MRKILQRIVLRLRKYLTLTEELRYEYKKILLTIYTTFAGIVATILFGILDLLHEHYFAAFMDISTSCIFIFALFLISNGKIQFGKLLVILYACFALLVNGSKDGRFAGNEFLWFPILGGIFLFFSIKEKGHILICLVGILTSIILLEISDYKFLLIPALVPELIYINYLLSFSTSLIIILIYIYYLIKSNSDTEKRLVRLNKTLLKKNENLKKTNDELDSFVYKASHDLRAPLASMLGLIQVSNKETNIDVIREYSALQEKSIRKLDSYILDILNISRNARLEIEMKEVLFKEMIAGVFDQFSFLENGSSLKRSISINQEGKFYGDLTRINIIFSNLISNSIRYLDSTKTENLIDITINSNAHSVTIIIADNGMGIQEEHLDKVFKMFYRATESNSGSGLGLYIVKEILSKLKGSIQIDSVYRKYTAVTIQIPNSVPLGK